MHGIAIEYKVALYEPAVDVVINVYIHTCKLIIIYKLIRLNNIISIS
jgi:hypothetical protein